MALGIGCFHGYGGVGVTPDHTGKFAFDFYGITGEFSVGVVGSRDEGQQQERQSEGRQST